MPNFVLSQNILENIFKTVVVLLIGLIVQILINKALHNVVKKFQAKTIKTNPLVENRIYTLTSLMQNTVGFVVFCTVILVIMSEWDINITPMLTGAGILGLAIGFGSQALVKDVVTGFFILFENSYNVGDKVTLAGKTGRVVRINLRTTMLEGEDKLSYTVPHSYIGIIEKFDNP